MEELVKLIEAEHDEIVHEHCGSKYSRGTSTQEAAVI
jgi:hypothetical protein